MDIGICIKKKKERKKGNIALIAKRVSYKKKKNTKCTRTKKIFNLNRNVERRRVKNQIRRAHIIFRGSYGAQIARNKN